MSARVDGRVNQRSVEVRPATPDRWDDLVTVFGRRGDDRGWCWCRLFLGSAADTSGAPATTPDHREALRHEVMKASTPPGLIAYLDDHPAGWSRVGPRSGFPRIAANRALARVLTDDAGAWWVTCFAIHAGHRRAGVGTALLEAAVAFARDHGARSLEGHPVDVDALKATRVSGSALFTGTMAMFVAVGFSEVGRTFSSRPVMRLVL